MDVVFSPLRPSQQILTGEAKFWNHVTALELRIMQSSAGKPQ